MSRPVDDRPAVSVILCSFNQARYLREAIESVLAQTMDDYELVLMDNGSTDGSPEIMKGYEADPRVRLVLFETNESITQRFNAAVDVARGDLVSFLFSDDFFLPDKLRRQVDVFAGLGRDYGVVYGPLLRCNEITGARWRSPSMRASGEIFADMMTRRGLPVEMIAPMIRRECLQQHRFHEDLFSEGEYVFFRIALTHKFAYVDEPLAVIRDHETNMGKAVQRNLENIRACLDKLRREPALRRNQRHLVDRFEGACLRGCGWQGARLDMDTRWTRSCFVAAIRVSPRQAMHPKTWFGVGLTLVPPRPRRLLNRLGHAIRRSPENALFLDDYQRPVLAPDRSRSR